MAQKPEIYEPHLQFWASLRLLLSFGRACGSSLLEQRRKTKPSRCLPPPRLRTHSMMLMQLLQSKVVSRSSSDTVPIPIVVSDGECLVWCPSLGGDSFLNEPRHLGGIVMATFGLEFRQPQFF